MATEPDRPEPASPRREVRRPRLTPGDVRDRRRRALLWGLSTALSVLLVNAIVGEHGYLAALSARRELNAVQATVAKLRMDNADLQAEGRRLATDPTALEETARRELGLIRPGETLIVIHDTPGPATPPASR
jgi:cell division protein FtsB